MTAEEDRKSSRLRFDGMTWPNPADPDEVQWRLRYGPQPPSREDLLTAASFMHAYAHLIDLPQRERNERVRQIRQQVLAAAETVVDAVAGAEADALAAHRAGTCSESPWSCSHCEAEGQL